MSTGLTTDEFDALGQIRASSKQGRPSACVARNAKRLNGLKYVTYTKDGGLILTEKGTQTLFMRNCIEGLRAISNNPLAVLEADVKTFLGKKGHIAPNAAADGFDITTKGRESLADIDATAA